MAAHRHGQRVIMIMHILARTHASVLCGLMLLCAGCAQTPGYLDPDSEPKTLTAQAILNKAYAPSNTPSPSQSPSPSSSPTATSTAPDTSQASPTPSPEDCVDRVAFIADATIPDHTAFYPSESFLKVWTLQNTGTCTWDSSYTLSFLDGDLMGSYAEVPLNQTVLPGQVTNMGIYFIAPDSDGTYQGFWRLRNAAGSFFGIGPTGDQPFWVLIVVSTTPTPTASPTPTTTSTATQTATSTTTSTP